MIDVAGMDAGAIMNKAWDEICQLKALLAPLS